MRALVDVDGLDGVDHEVQQRLLHLGGGGGGRFEPFGQLVSQFDAVGEHPERQAIELRDELVEIGATKLEGAPA